MNHFVPMKVLYYSGKTDNLWYVNIKITHRHIHTPKNFHNGYVTSFIPVLFINNVMGSINTAEIAR